MAPSRVWRTSPAADHPSPRPCSTSNFPEQQCPSTLRTLTSQRLVDSTIMSASWSADSGRFEYCSASPHPFPLPPNVQLTLGTVSLGVPWIAPLVQRIPTPVPRKAGHYSTWPNERWQGRSRHRPGIHVHALVLSLADDRKQEEAVPRGTASSPRYGSTYSLRTIPGPNMIRRVQRRTVKTRKNSSHKDLLHHHNRVPGLAMRMRA